MLRQGFGRRLVAALIDGVILIVVLVVLGFVLPAGKIAMLVQALVLLGYGAMEIVRAQTVGKMVMGMKITRQDGSPADMQMLTTRYLIKNAASFIGIIYALATIAPIHWLQILAGLAVFVGCFLALRPDKLALHDIIAKTAVFGGDGMPAGFPVMATTTPATDAPASSVA